MQRHQSARSGALERRGNRAQRMVPAGASSVANTARGYRFWHRRSADDLRSDWREVLDLPGRKDSRAREARNDDSLSSRLRKQATDYVDAQEGEVPQAAARPAQR